MERQSRQQIHSRLRGVNTTRVERILGIGLGVGAIAASVATMFAGRERIVPTFSAPTRTRIAIGAPIGILGLALLARGVSGRCPITRKLAKRRIDRELDTESADELWAAEALFIEPNQGEGDRRAARSYDQGLRDYIEGEDIVSAARAAAIAVDSPEGADLRRAEEAGKAPLKRGPL